MSATTDYMSPFNDGYNIFNQFDRILFVAKHPLLQSELNELQSGQQAQQRWLADWTMNNGTILSGMGYKNEGYSAGNSISDNTNPNLFSTNNLIANPNNYEDLIVTMGDNYTDHGEIDVTSNATDDSQPLDMNISYEIPSNTQYITTSFDICETGGTDDGELQNIGVELHNGTSITEATIDGRVLKNGELENDAKYNLTDTSNDMINLSDGNYHQVVITMDVSKVGSNTNSFDLILNAGYPSVADGCNVKFDHFKIEQGTEPTTWELNSQDIPNGSDKRNDKIFISSGFVYLDGYVRYFNAQSINIKGEGFEQIGLRLTHSTVNGASDKEIDDQTQGTQIYGMPGADRQRYNLDLTYSNSDTAISHNVIIYYLYNGRVIANANWNRSERFENVLAQRTYETNGSFLAKGLQMYAQPNRLNSDLINLQFTPGVAYVMGHRIQKDGSDILPIPTERETMRMEESRILQTTGGSANSYKDISFDNPYIRPEYEMNPADNNEYTGGIRVTDQTASPQLFNIEIDYGEPSKPTTPVSSSHHFDMNNDQLLIDDNAYIIDPKEPSLHYYKDHIENTVTKGVAKVKNFATASDSGYNLDGNEIQWVNENSPFQSGGSAEICTYVQMSYYPYNSAYEIQSSNNGEATNNTQHTQSNINNTPDFYLIEHNNKYYISFNENDKKLDITGAADKPDVHLSGVTPAVNDSDHQVDITYYTYLSRKDLITIDRNGHFFDIKGDADLQNHIMPPINKSRGDNLTLDIGYITVLPNQQVVHTQMSTIPKVPFTNINSMRLELAALSYNMSVLSARQSGMNYIDPVTLIDIFSDFFTGTSKANLVDANFHILYNAAPYITPEYEAEGYAPLICFTPLPADQSTLTMPRKSLKAGAYDENTNYLNQDHQSTSSLPLNNFGLRENVGNIICDPNYINDKLTTEQIEEPTTLEVMDNDNVQNYLYQHNNPNDPYNILYTDGEKGLVDDHLTDLNDMNGTLPKGGTEFQKKTTTTKMYNRAYIAPQFIHIQGSGFIPNSTGYSVVLPNENDLHLAVRPNLSDLNPHLAKLPGANNANNFSTNSISTKPGTVNADGNGSISCWFMIPKGQVHAGTQTVCLQNDGGEYAIDHIDGNETQPVQYNTTDDVVADNYDLVNAYHNIDSEGINSLSASASQQASYLSTQVASLSTSTSFDVESLSNVESEDDSALNSAIGSGDASMDAITSAEQQDSANLSSLTDTVTNFDSYVASGMSAQVELDSDFMSNENNLYSSANSLYVDHLETEGQLGYVRSDIDSVADNENMTALELNADVQQYNADFNNVDTWESQANNAFQTDANAIDTNAQRISTNQEQNQQVNTKMWAAGSHTFRQLVYRETNPDVMAFGSQGNGFQQWCTKWHMDPALVYNVNYDLLKSYTPMYKTWRASSDWTKSQTQGGIWISGVEIVSPYEQGTPQAYADASNKLQEASSKFHGVHLLNTHSVFASVPINMKSLIPRSELRSIKNILKPHKKHRKGKRSTLRNRIRHHK